VRKKKFFAPPGGGGVEKGGAGKEWKSPPGEKEGKRPIEKPESKGSAVQETYREKGEKIEGKGGVKTRKGRYGTKRRRDVLFRGVGKSLVGGIAGEAEGGQLGGGDRPGPESEGGGQGLPIQGVKDRNYSLTKRKRGPPGT